MIPEYVLGSLQGVDHTGEVDEAPQLRCEVDVRRSQDAGDAPCPHHLQQGGEYFLVINLLI